MTQAEAQEIIRNQRKSNGLCQRCGKTAMIDKTICQICSSQLSSNRKELQILRLSQKLCIKCGKFPHRTNAQRCETCTLYEKKNARNIYELRAAAQTCRYCDLPRVGQSTLCYKHYFAQAGKRYFNKTSMGPQLEQKLINQNYKCYLDGEQLIIGTNTCIDHMKATKYFPELRNDISNMAWACQPCNLSKRAKSNIEFIEYCKKIVIYNSVLLAQ